MNIYPDYCRSFLLDLPKQNIYLDSKYDVTINDDPMTGDNATVSYATIRRYCNAVVSSIKIKCFQYFTIEEKVRK